MWKTASVNVGAREALMAGPIRMEQLHPIRSRSSSESVHLLAPLGAECSRSTSWFRVVHLLKGRRAKCLNGFPGLVLEFLRGFAALFASDFQAGLSDFFLFRF